MKHFAVLAILWLGTGACSCTDRQAASAATASSRAEVAGTVLDRTTGSPIEGARVVFPDGREMRTDAQGRFLATDLALGLAGELAARTDDGRSGQVTLRRLLPGRLEVVLHVGR
ncbi:MAG: carboxypeptidase-like regulatory domain-containing protein [Planctomycetota bacterium]|nr:carboxypeptidase-like regulatory domain-containing protein [Planctomycetota bacterium]